MPPLEAGLLAAAAAVIFAAALLSSVVGFAFSALAGAALLRLLGDPACAVSVLLVCSIAIQSYSVVALRKHLEWRRLLPFLAGGAATVPVGVWLLQHMPVRVFGATLGTLVLGYAAYMMWRREGARSYPQAGPLADALAGALGGLTGGLAGFPGLAVTIWCGLRGWTKETQRGVFQPYILLMQLEALALLQAGGTPMLAPLSLGLLAAMALVAACIGVAYFRRMTNAQFNTMVYLLLAASGASLLSGAV